MDLGGALIPELGHFARVLALALGVLPSRRLMRGDTAIAPVARGQSVSALVAHDFSVRYLAERSHTALSVVRRISAALWCAPGRMVLSHRIAPCVAAAPNAEARARLQSPMRAGSAGAPG